MIVALVVKFRLQKNILKRKSIIFSPIKHQPINIGAQIIIKMIEINSKIPTEIE